jgi:hypothetical protein
VTENTADLSSKLKNDDIQRMISNVRTYGKDMCYSCKGDLLLCNYRRCPILTRTVLPIKGLPDIEMVMAGPTHSLYVDWFGYPEVKLGPMISTNSDLAEKATDPSAWYGLTLEQVLALRSQVVQAQTLHDVENLDRFIENLQEIALSIKPVEAELRFRNKPETSMMFSSVCEPIGPTGDLEYMKLSGNPSVPSRVDQEISSKTQALDAIWNLYNEGFDIYYLQRLIAAGVFNEGRKKAIMPTSWAIPSVDKHIGNCLADTISQYPSLKVCRVFSTSYLGNHYEILLLPGDWRFEYFETWAPNTLWTLAYARPAIYQDFEGYSIGTEHMRKGNGSYAAIRFAVLEQLAKMGMSGTAIVFREVASDYSLPLGVWHVREAVRHAFEATPDAYDAVEDALKAISIRLQTPLAEYTRHGVILKQDYIDGISMNT